MTFLKANTDFRRDRNVVRQVQGAFQACEGSLVYMFIIRKYIAAV